MDGTALITNADAIIMARECWRKPRHWWILANIAPQREEFSRFVEHPALVPKRVTHWLRAFGAEPQEDPVGNHMERVVVALSKGFSGPGAVVPK